MSVYYSRSDHGHRASYAEIFERELGLSRVGVAAALFHRDPVLFAMIEDRPLFYILFSIIRAVIGKKTVGLIFQPTTTVLHESLRRWVKYILLRILRHIKSVRTLAIERFEPGDREGEICDDFIYDPQLWDLSEEELAGILHRRPMVDPGAAAANDGRRVLAAIGVQSRGKCFELFLKTFADTEVASSWVFVFGGKVEPSLKCVSQKFITAGGIGLDRHLSDEEIISIYAAADLVWCLYDKSYDQASGVFGRAVQAGILPLVRRGSRLQQFCICENIPHVAAETSNLITVILKTFPERVVPPVDETARRREHSLRILANALRR